MRRALPLALAASLLAGCGSSHLRLDGAARYVPADAELFVAFDTHDAHWRPFAQMVLGRVPTVPRGVRIVAYARVRGKLALVRPTKLAHPLADSVRYRATLDSLPHGARGIAYVRGDVAAARLRATPGQLTLVVNRYRRGYRSRTRAHSSSIAHVQYRWAAAWLTKDGMGMRARSGGLPLAETEFVRALEQLSPGYAPLLFDEIPADAQSVLDLSLPGGAFENLPKLPTPIAKLFTGSQIGIAAELDQIFQGETALYTRAGGETTIVTQPGDLFAALKAVAELPPLRHFRHTFLGGQLVLSTSRGGIVAFRGGGPKLAAELGLPAKVHAVVYRAHRLLGWVESVGGDPVLTVRFEGTSG